MLMAMLVMLQMGHDDGDEYGDDGGGGGADKDDGDEWRC